MQILLPTDMSGHKQSVLSVMRFPSFSSRIKTTFPMVSTKPVNIGYFPTPIAESPKGNFEYIRPLGENISKV
jgi:hypothetical protein